MLLLHALLLGGAPAPIALTEGGIGKLTAKTRVSTKELEKLFPGTKISTEDETSEGQVVGTRFVVTDGADKLFEVAVESKSKKPVRVDVDSPVVKTPEGIHVGSPLDDLLTLGKTKKLACGQGVEE